MSENPVHTSKAVYGAYPWLAFVVPRIAIPVAIGLVLMAFGFSVCAIFAATVFAIGWSASAFLVG